MKVCKDLKKYWFLLKRWISKEKCNLKKYLKNKNVNCKKNFVRSKKQ